MPNRCALMAAPRYWRISVAKESHYVCNVQTCQGAHRTICRVLVPDTVGPQPSHRIAQRPGEPWVYLAGNWAKESADHDFGAISVDSELSCPVLVTRELSAASG